MQKPTLSLILFLLAVTTLRSRAIDFTAKQLAARLRENSPCAMALATPSSSRGREILYSPLLVCFLETYENSIKGCALTGYNVELDKFAPLIKGAGVSSNKSCSEGGFQSLGGISNREIAKIFENTTISFSADPMFEKIAYPPYIGFLPKGSKKEYPQETPPPKPVVKDLAPYQTVTVYYATDRMPNANVPAEIFSDARNNDGELSLGLAEVSIPENHLRGRIETPSIYSFEIKANPAEHIVILKNSPSTPDKFFAALKARTAASSRREIFVFVHGYNTTFVEALKRTAQFAFDLKFEGAPVLYSWPAGEKLWQYPIAEANIDWTFRHLEKFLVDVSNRTGALKIHLIAHSMGNRALTYALNELSLKNPQKRFREVILAAPDIDTAAFEQVAKQIALTSSRITIYASQTDKALEASKKFHEYRRLGQSGVDIFLSPKVDTIDATDSDNSVMGHSYFGDSVSAMTDISQLLKDGAPPVSRPLLVRQNLSPNVFWRLKPGTSALP